MFGVALAGCVDTGTDRTTGQHTAAMTSSETEEVTRNIAAASASAVLVVPREMVQPCRGQFAGSACSVERDDVSYDGVCTQLPLVQGLVCLPPPPACHYCGDGIVDSAAGEACDPGAAGLTSTCNFNCTPSVCGDGIVNPAAGEACDPGAPGVSTAFCNSNCTTSRCGDGIVNQAAGEQCDEGGINTSTCNANCTLPRCGDGIVNVLAGEQCDDGPLGSPYCTPSCTRICP